MILHLQKRLYVPGDEELTCAIGISEGWAGELKGQYLNVSKRVPGWKFFYPHSGDASDYDDMNISYCGKVTSVPYHPQFVYVNDYVYRLPGYIPFSPIN